MREKPENWEVICKICFSGFIMSDTEATYRLGRNADRLWPKHCGKSMSLRHILDVITKEECSHTGCWAALNGVCNCSCRGKNHGVTNPNPQYTKVKVGEIAWYKRPIKTFISPPQQ